ncbi:MAG: type II secretion system protein [Candidatus Zixiibacteriota bacterium]
MFRRHRDNRGFTLIELMIVVVIIGILAAMAIPRFMKATTKTKQSEARLILKQIYVNQQAYKQQTGSYYITAATASNGNPDAFAEIWVQVMTPAKYSYTINATANTFTATATGNIDDDAAEDIWTINDGGTMVNTSNDAVL